MGALELIKQALQAECGVNPATIDEQTNLLNDLDVDSLDLLNASFMIEKTCGVALPVQEWLAQEYGENSTNTRLFVVSEICAFLEGEMSRTRGYSASGA